MKDGIENIETAIKDLNEAVEGLETCVKGFDEGDAANSNSSTIMKPFSIVGNQLYLPEGSVIVRNVMPIYKDGGITYRTENVSFADSTGYGMTPVPKGDIYCIVTKTEEGAYVGTIASESDISAFASFKVGAIDAATGAVTQNVFGAVILSDFGNAMRPMKPFEVVDVGKLDKDHPLFDANGGRKIYMPELSIVYKNENVPVEGIDEKGWFAVDGESNMGYDCVIVESADDTYVGKIYQEDDKDREEGVLTFPIFRYSDTRRYVFGDMANVVQCQLGTVNLSAYIKKIDMENPTPFTILETKGENGEVVYKVAVPFGSVFGNDNLALPIENVDEDGIWWTVPRPEGANEVTVYCNVYEFNALMSLEVDSNALHTINVAKIWWEE